MFFPDSSTLYIPPFSPFFRLPTTRRIYSVYTFDLSFFIHVRSITGRLRRRYNFEDDETTGNQETERERKREQEIKKNSVSQRAEYPKTKRLGAIVERVSSDCTRPPRLGSP